MLPPPPDTFQVDLGDWESKRKQTKEKRLLRTHPGDAQGQSRVGSALDAETPRQAAEEPHATLAARRRHRRRLHRIRAGHWSHWNTRQQQKGNPLDHQVQPRKEERRDFYRVLPSFFRTFCLTATTLPGFCRHLFSLTDFDWVSLIFYRVLPSFTGSNRILLGFTDFYWVLLNFTGFYHVLLAFIVFNWI